MSAATITGGSEAPLPRGIGLPGRVALTWAMAGGILLGGGVVAIMTLAGFMSAYGLFLTSTGLFAVGAVIGFIHGGVLGFVGRPSGLPKRSAAAGVAMAALYAIPGLAVAWLLAVWIAMTVVALYLERIAPLAGVAVGWILGLLLVAVAVAFGVRALRNAYARWPEARAGTVLVAMTFAALLLTFLADRPELWGIRFRVTETGAVLLAAAVTLWVVGPVVSLALRLLREIPLRPVLGFGSGRRAVVDVAVGLAVGLVLGLIAVPFAAPGSAAATGALGTLVVALSQAMVDEVLLRLFLLTGAVWMLLRWHRVHPEEAAVTSVIAVALIQILLYAPGVAAVGFPTTVAALGFVAAAVAIPAVAFSVLYLKRGFGAALIADATAVAALALLTI